MRIQERGTEKPCKTCGKVPCVPNRRVCRECRNAEQRAYNVRSKDRRKRTDKEYYENNRERILAQKKEYGSQPEVRERSRRLKKLRRHMDQEYAERVRAYNRKSYKNNKPTYIAKDARRRAAIMQRTPPWANLKKIKRIYELAAWVSKFTDEPLHVDHIIPLQGKKISGLHVENNLQIIPASENFKKHNKFSEDIV